MRYNKFINIFQRNHDILNRLLSNIDIDTLRKLKIQGDKIAKLIEKQKKVIFFGNGGSAADSDHIVTEFTVRFKINRKPYPAISLGCNTSTITAIGNDFKFEEIFSRQIDGIAKPGDFCIGLTTSGNSKNIIEAVKLMNKKKIDFSIWSGNKGGKIKNLTDKILLINSKDTANIQILHKFFGHLICEYVEEIIQKK